MTDPEGGVNNYTYDTLNRLTGLQNFQSQNFTFNYDSLNRLASLLRPNGVNTSYAYDSVSRLLSVLHQAGTNTLDGASYTYDSAGNRLTKTDLPSSTTSNYTYDFHLSAHPNGKGRQHYGDLHLRPGRQSPQFHHCSDLQLQQFQSASLPTPQ